MPGGGDQWEKQMNKQRDICNTFDILLIKRVERYYNLGAYCIMKIRNILEFRIPVKSTESVWYKWSFGLQMKEGLGSALCPHIYPNLMALTTSSL